MNHPAPPGGLDQLRLRHLRFLIALATHQHLGRAADELAMTQPAASRLLSELERRFGRPLFDRGRHGVRPLPAATGVLRFARMVCAEQELVKQSLGADGERPAVLRVGTLPTMPSVVFHAIDRYKQQRPDGDILLRHATLDVLLPLLLDGELDLVIGRFDPLLARPPLMYERLVEEPLSVVAGPSHPLRRRRRIPPEVLRRHPWVAPVRSSSLYPHFAELFGGLPLPDDLIECASPWTVQRLLQDNRRLALLGASALAPPGGDGLKRLSVAMPSPPGPMGVYVVDGRMVAQECASFRRALFAQAR